LATAFFSATGAAATGAAATGAGAAAVSTASFFATRLVTGLAEVEVEFIVLVPVEEFICILRTTCLFINSVRSNLSHAIHFFM
jgi:hypothetical protein